MIGSALHRDWLSVLSLMGTLRHLHLVRVDNQECEPFGPYHRLRLEVPIQEGSRSLATDTFMSNHVISTVALIGLSKS